MNTWKSVQTGLPKSSGWYHGATNKGKVIATYFNSRTNKFYTAPEGLEVEIISYQYWEI